MLNPFQLTIKSFETRLATPEDKHLPVYDHTALSAINTCPTWGIVRYIHHKRMGGADRELALEAGDAAHQVYAAHRLYQLMKHQNQPKLAEYHGRRIFGDRYDALLSKLDSTATTRTECINFSLEALYTSGFYDDPYDKNRTVDNIAEACIVYFDSQDFTRYPIWIRNPLDQISDVGIEIAFDIVVTITFEQDVPPLVFRYSGKLDAILEDKTNLIVCDNKTGARIDDAWLAQWRMSHQLTGYCAAVSTWTGQTCSKARAIGMRIPIGKDLSSGVRSENVPRNPYLFDAFARWLVHTVSLLQAYQDNPINAPRYTHSCNRYFRACSFLPLCDSPIDEQRRTFDEMQFDQWSPLDGD